MFLRWPERALRGGDFQILYQGEEFSLDSRFESCSEYQSNEDYHWAGIEWVEASLHLAQLCLLRLEQGHGLQLKLKLVAILLSYDCLGLLCCRRHLWWFHWIIKKMSKLFIVLVICSYFRTFWLMTLSGFDSSTTLKFRFFLYSENVIEKCRNKLRLQLADTYYILARRLFGTFFMFCITFMLTLLVECFEFGSYCLLFRFSINLLDFLYLFLQFV